MTPAAFANSVSDPSFEKPRITTGTYRNFVVGQTIHNDWNVVGPAGAVISVISCPYTEGGINFFAPDGSNFVDLTGPGSNQVAGVSQVVATTAGATYTLKFKVGNFSGSSTVNVQVDGVQAFTATNTTVGTTVNWQPFSFSFVAANASTTIAFLNGDSPSDHFNGLDNIVMHK
jgi:hypothetical protein